MMGTVEKELVSIGIAVAAGCKSCLAYHLHAARNAGAADAEIERIVGEAIRVRDHATRVAEAAALDHTPPPLDASAATDWVGALAAIGAAYAVTCPTTLEQRLAAGRDAGLSPNDVRSVARLADFIRDKATSHVVDLVPK